MTDPITVFRGKYNFLSNFYPATVELDGLLYPSVENAYQAAKTFSDRTFYLHCTPVQAKKRKDIVQPDWELIKLRIMDDLLRQKFAPDTPLAWKLVGTNDAEIIHENYWHDTYWGVCKQQGANHLGKLLMKIRKELVA